MIASLKRLWRVPPRQTISEIRYIELDWLRVLAFGLLIFYHTGMLYVESWGFHFKSRYLSASVENAMLLLSPWRMGLIWFISGAAIGCLLTKQSLSNFLATRTIKILLPLLVAIWLVIPIQLYAQMHQEIGLKLGFLEFYIAFFDLEHPIFAQYQAGIWPHVDVNHLWYLRSLWQFTLVIVLLIPILKSTKLQSFLDRFTQVPVIWIYFGLLLPLCILKLNWPSDTFRYPMGFIFLLYGFLLTPQRQFMLALAEKWFYLLWLFLLGYLCVLWGYHQIWHNPESQPWQITSVDILYTAQRLLGVLTMLALATRFLTNSHPLLPKLNKIIFPFYIFHQSVIIALAYYLTPLQLGYWLEPGLIIILTFVLCSLVCWILTKFELLSLLFGMKLSKKASSQQQKLGQIIGLIIVTPIMIRLLF